MSFQKINLSDLKSNAKVKPEIMEKVWLLNLDQIESNTGKVLNYEEVPFQGIGSSTIYFQKGTVLYSKLRPYLNKVVIADRNGFATSELVPIVCNEELIYPKYLAYFLRSESFLKFASNVVAGAKMPRMVMSEFWNYEIPLPPLSEQKRIAKILDKADELRQKRQQSIEKLDELLQATFIDMFGDPVTNPKNLDYIQLGKLGNWASGGTPSRSNKTFFNGTIPWYTSGELNNIYVSDSIEKISIEAIENSSTKLIPIGSLLLGMYDTAGLKSSITTIDSACNQAIAFAKINDNLANKLFVYHQIQLIKEHLKQKQRGVRQKNFNLTMIKEIEILNPKLELQNSFAKTAARIEQQKQTLLKQLNEQKNLFQSLQQRAFNGEL
ncbi:restriction endonuclease subunit S [Moraxella sp. PS-22]|uniref:Restriction endonuclease subunit S n=1 Tax=Moraxella tetraodonis TaxID=2767221 RepID=A0A9X2A6F5_9GAMM|nr:restriction endonuclease subunit S [Moraxella tetraodonis]